MVHNHHHPDALEYVLEGKPSASCQVRITDTSGETLPEDTIGLIEISGDNVTRGYYDDPETNERLIHDHWVNTGDLGFLHQKELIVTGRMKDIIFVNGQNLYPHDLEHAAQEIEGMEMGKVAFAGVREREEQDSILAFVLHKGSEERLVPLARELKIRMAQEFALEIDAIVPVKRMPKTTSGKIQRYQLVESYLTGEFKASTDALTGLMTQTRSEDSADELESTLLNIAREFITDKELSTEDNIFEIGTSSLTLAQIHERIEEKFPGQLDITDFFEYPTIKEIAEFLSDKRGTQPA
jgi:long-subunit acyl-CoA synthetase (AMP-forming)